MVRGHWVTCDVCGEAVVRPCNCDLYDDDHEDAEVCDPCWDGDDLVVVQRGDRCFLVRNEGPS